MFWLLSALTGLTVVNLVVLLARPNGPRDLSALQGQLSSLERTLGDGSARGLCAIVSVWFIDQPFRECDGGRLIAACACCVARSSCSGRALSEMRDLPNFPRARELDG